MEEGRCSEIWIFLAGKFLLSFSFCLKRQVCSNFKGQIPSSTYPIGQVLDIDPEIFAKPLCEQIFCDKTLSYLKFLKRRVCAGEMLIYPMIGRSLSFYPHIRCQAIFGFIFMRKNFPAPLNSNFVSSATLPPLPGGIKCVPAWKNRRFSIWRLV